MQLEKILEEIESKEFTNMTIRHSMVVKMKDVRSIIRKHMNDGWIPVEERLPEEPKENPEFEGKALELYLVDIGARYPLRAFWNGKQFTDGWSVLKVIAWRPLPEPYRPEPETEKPDWREDMLRKFDRRE